MTNHINAVCIYMTSQLIYLTSDMISLDIYMTSHIICLTSDMIAQDIAGPPRPCRRIGEMERQSV